MLVIVSALFALFTAVHYIYPAIFLGHWDTWEITDPGLYRHGCTLPNILMVSHMIGGVYLMAAGPINPADPIHSKTIHQLASMDRAILYHCCYSYFHLCS
jgi:hypothetical protein